MYRRVLFDIFCLISIGLALSDEANNMKLIKSIILSVIYENLSPIYQIVSEKFSSLKNPKVYKECMSSLTFCHPVILQFLIAAIFFVTDRKELKLAQIG